MPGINLPTGTSNFRAAKEGLFGLPDYFMTLMGFVPAFLGIIAAVIACIVCQCRGRGKTRREEKPPEARAQPILFADIQENEKREAARREASKAKGGCCVGDGGGGCGGCVGGCG